MTKKPKDDGTRSGRMEGPRLPIRKDFPFNLAEGGKTPTGRNKTLPQFIDFETRSEVPLMPSIREQVIEAAMMKFPGRTLEEVTLPNNEGYALRPYQQEMLRSVMETAPEFETPVEGDIYKDFVDRYAKGDTTPGERRARFNPLMGKPYGGKMRDYMRQHTYFASGSADFMRKADAMRRFYVLGGGEGNRQLAYYAYGMALSQTADNWVDDVYDRKQRRAEAKLREYCMADVWITADYAAIERRIMFTLLDGYPTVDVTHRLKAPYGREPSSTDWGIAISIRFTGLRPRGFVQDEPLAEWPDRQLADMIGGAVTGFGCPEFISRKVADTVYASGRYDCCITLSKLALLNLQSVMQELRCEVVVVCDDRRGWRGLPCYAPDSDKDMR
ncbi:hypothetical protein POLUDNITSA_00730 [Brevundimonas phage vB_BpoS-Poludnitsa]|nr:hypothetical protein POLUDNITSA_00730 [Brevundimonas phage vB_BpoS-Poludnitsa]